jgi:hypothetical protein
MNVSPRLPPNFRPIRGTLIGRDPGREQLGFVSMPRVVRVAEQLAPDVDGGAVATAVSEAAGRLLEQTAPFEARPVCREPVRGFGSVDESTGFEVRLEQHLESGR